MKITVYGRVQGVGFRPYVAELAEQLGISGTVCNSGGIVTIHASGTEEALNGLVHRLSVLKGTKQNDVFAGKEELPGARVDRIEVSDEETEPDGESEWQLLSPEKPETDREAEQTGESGRREKPVESQCTGFRIVKSRPHRDRLRFLPPDIATCDGCLKELFDPENRRYRYPFISCTSCGPRFSIMEQIPYDRETITMREFEMCPDCREEYLRKGDVRRHAQTIACAACGPQLTLYVRREPVYRSWTGERALQESISRIREGKIIAIKDIGGYHLAFDPHREKAAERLREWKNREKKPFAVMFADADSAAAYCEISETERKLLESDARPIVLLKKKKGRDFADGVCGSSDRMGVLLPCNPLQHLIIRETGPLVMTSGNRGGEPIITEDEKMCGLLQTGVPDAVLANDRRIRFGLDDSIYQVTVCGKREIVQIIRRARGLVPEPVPLPCSLDEDVFAAGGDLKAVFALGRGNMAYLSGHFGDLDDMRAEELREKAVGGMSGLLGISPTAAVCDRHPNYISGREVRKKFAPERIRTVGHHYAHAAAVIAEYHLEGPVIGVAYDGTGYGEDGTVWGGEILLCENFNARRAGQIRSVRLIGGDSAAKQAAVTAFCYLQEAVQDGIMTREEADRALEGLVESDRRKLLAAAWENGINAAASSSMGRLFDAVSALLGICVYNSFEGECPQLLQREAQRYWDRIQETPGAGKEPEESGTAQSPGARKEPEERGKVQPPGAGEEYFRKTDGVWVWDSVRLVADLAKRKLQGEDAGKLAYEFHRAIADMTVQLCLLAAENCEAGSRTAALAGGTMYNGLLLKLLIPKLSEQGFEVYVNEKVPSGDGGLAYGQLYLYSGNQL